MTRPLRALLVGVAALALVAVVVASGVVPLRASSGHWSVTEALLHFAMRRSVQTHAAGIRAPDLEDPAMVLAGAGHYEAGCRPCHGAPGGGRPVLAQHMTPAPPWLPPRIAAWRPAELFYIVKHGVKPTGMPAWPTAQRDDEVWAVVAFLQVLPDLDADGYAALVEPDAPPRPTPSARDTAARLCARCHGADGEGHPSGAFPRLAGQRRAWLEATLEAYARGDRPSGIMQPVAAALPPDARRALAAHYAALSPAPPAPVADPQAVQRGRRVAHEGVPEDRVPSCVDCHGPGPGPRREDYPRLAGQHERFLALQLELFRDGRRGGTRWSHVMREVAAHDLRDEDLLAVAAWYASLDPEPPDGDPASGAGR